MGGKYNLYTIRIVCCTYTMLCYINVVVIQSVLQSNANRDPEHNWHCTYYVILHMRINHTMALYVHSINRRTHIIKYISKKYTTCTIQRILLISELHESANRDPYTINIVGIMSNYICILIMQRHHTYTVLTYINT